MANKKLEEELAQYSNLKESLKNKLQIISTHQKESMKAIKDKDSIIEQQQQEIQHQNLLINEKREMIDQLSHSLSELKESYLEQMSN